MRNPAVYSFAVLCLAAAVIAGATHASAGQGQDEELQLGQEVFNELKAKGEIIDSSPLYGQLRPIADAIARVAQPGAPPL